MMKHTTNDSQSKIFFFMIWGSFFYSVESFLSSVNSFSEGSHIHLYKLHHIIISDTRFRKEVREGRREAGFSVRSPQERISGEFNMFLNTCLHSPIRISSPISLKEKLRNI